MLLDMRLSLSTLMGSPLSPTQTSTNHPRKSPVATFADDGSFWIGQAVQAKGVGHGILRPAGSGDRKGPVSERSIESEAPRGSFRQ